MVVLRSVRRLLPYMGRGLPTSNLEAIRLLAHSFLYEIDDVVKQKTNNNFTRWMDDIIIGVDERKEAIEIISSISDMLKSRGLALNLSKTDIYNQTEAFYHFQIDENKYIDSLEGIDKLHPDYNSITTELKKNFQKHFKDKTPKYWDKIAKRYITTFGKLRSPKLLTEIVYVYLTFPGLRQNLLYYLANLGYKKRTAKAVEEILDGLNVFDDISLYQLCHLLTLWEIPINNDAKEFLDRIDAQIVSISFSRKTPSDFYSVLWFKSKYNHPEDLFKFVKKYQNLWQADSFLRRQVTGVLSRVWLTNQGEV